MRMVESSASEPTRRALLQSASKIFAEQGFQIARIRDIAENAGTNLSAINYHFGSKKGLYYAVLESVAQTTIERFPLLSSDSSHLSPEQRFRFLVRNLLRRFISPDTPSVLAQLMTRELSHPTQALDDLVNRVSRPQFMTAASVIREIVSPDISQEQVQQAVLSVFGQCIVYLFARPLISRLLPQDVYSSEQSIDQIADHIATFSLAGLQAMQPLEGS
ncbi:hypothetical protein BTA51_04060 [Hahella sp. CCB-MM4]|uniref:CerR family C-terminal domain-containing protein n=1 Tax=Hahella sp. (strain CCB-MM4) TaxID=1926491 RepID=UPI000B9ADB30|nr:CerR family C-terminal domain-containing protein [Hahella sp. CCB-MM4]OZG74200.1 hypothetical protein BTA51_04060 [Hahella sp. CCB-MM4]